MTYRNDEEAQRARIEELERKLQTADAEIALLRGGAPGSAPGTRVEHSRIGGGPSRYEREVLVDHAISDLGYEAIAEVLRKRLGLEAKQVGRALSVPGAFTLSRDAAGTRIRMTADWRALGRGVVAASVMAGSFGGLGSLGVTLDVLSHGLVGHGAMPALVSVAALGLTSAIALGTGWLTRRRTARLSREQLAAYEGTFEAILALAEEHAVREVAPTRVAEAADDEAQADEASDGAVAAGHAEIR